MRDIRHDLRQRLAALRKERDVLQAQLKAKLLEIDDYEEHLDGLLALEEKRAGSKPNERKVPKSEKTQAEIDAEFEADILAIINDGKDWQHADIKAAMEKKSWETPGSIGRAIQGTLLSLMKNRGLVQSVGKGIWRKVKKADASAA